MDTTSNTGSAVVDLKQTKRQPHAHIRTIDLKDKILPHSESAEQGLLGCVMRENGSGECLDLCMSKFGSEAKHVFYDLRHQAIFDMMMAMYQRRELIDLITICTHLKDSGQMEAIGGFPYIASMPDATPSAANAPFYIDILWEKFLLRKMLACSQDVINDVYESNSDLQTLVNSTAEKFSGIAEQSAANQDDVKDAKKTIITLSDIVDERVKNRNTMPGLTTGFPDLDNHILGLQKKRLHIIGARPSQGKSAMMGNMVSHLSASRNIPTLTFSFEMPAENLMLRIACGIAKVDSASVMKGCISDQEQERLFSVMVSLSRCPIHIVDNSSMNTLQMRAITRNHIKRHGVKAVFIDYAQRIKPMRVQEKKTYEIGEISADVQGMAKELDIPVVMLAQLKREYQDQNQPNKKSYRLPTMADLGDSGMLERDADVIALLARYPDQNLSADVWEYKINIDKARDATVGVIDLIFFKRWTKFESVQKE